MTGFIEIFETARDYTLQFTTTTTTTTTTHTHTVSTVTSSMPLVGNGLHSSRFPDGRRPQLPDSYSNSSQRLNPSSPLTNTLHGLSPRSNYTDRATAACRRSDCQLLRIEGATWSA
jgi:hypothetical protein